MKDLLMKRRSIRKYTAAPIEKEKVDQLVRAALLSPTSRNNRPWEFICVQERNLLEQLGEAKAGAQMLKGAALGIVVLADPEQSDVWVEDTSIASIIIQLTAQSLGLGSCWLQIRNRKHQDDITSDQYVKQVLNIPDKFQVESIISIGYPDESRPDHSEDELLWERLHRNRFGEAYKA